MTFARLVRWFFGSVFMLFGFSMCLALVMGLGTEIPHQIMVGSLAVFFLGIGIVLTFYLDSCRCRRLRQERLGRIKGAYAKGSILLDCVTEGSKGEWVMELEPDKAVLHWPDGGFTGGVPLADAERVIKLPGFGEDRSQLLVELGDRSLVFRNPGSDVRRIRRWIDFALALAHPERLGQVRRGGWRDLAIGVGLIVAGVTVSWASFKAVEERGGRYYILHGIALVGLVYLVKGVSGMRRSRRLARLIAEAEMMGMRVPVAGPSASPDQGRPLP